MHGRNDFSRGDRRQEVDLIRSRGAGGGQVEGLKLEAVSQSFFSFNSTTTRPDLLVWFASSPTTHFTLFFLAFTLLPSILLKTLNALTPVFSQCLDLPPTDQRRESRKVSGAGRRLNCLPSSGSVVIRRLVENQVSQLVYPHN